METCQYVTRTERGVRKHGREQHGWVFERKKRVNIAQQAKQARDNPWTTGVQCQRFFRSHVASGWFEVGRASQKPERQPTEAEDIVERI
ncbi:aldehyde reductase II [Metarhizium robertsii ARSEF 23]|uniref:Aldehyde reductase II n=1 Tax=Metarhizium robertsii (strain ARSEF 23 / ATCC MYA-3075) TaxID=655844 RepID=A0A0B2X911_METRA|nr:aldehyde reductase II [Metarhizium robertsii ARSEF 23]KHO11383.1 aldehyde reductase II [Metarhizium robertsii ARSEF 23]